MKMKLVEVLRTLLAIFLLPTYLFPIYWLITSAFKTEYDVVSIPPKFIFSPTLENFKRSLSFGGARALLNSVIVTLFSVSLVMIVSSLAAYCFSRFKFKGRETLMLDILTVRMFPPIVTALPLYFIASSLGLINSHLILILVYSMFNAPLATWLMKSFIDEVPLEIEEAASIDGCSHLERLRHIVLPLVLPGVIVTMTICSIFIWNEFLYATLLVGGGPNKTFPVQVALTVKHKSIAWGEACALGTISILPILAIFILVRNYLVRGLTFGILKA